MTLTMFVLVAFCLLVVLAALGAAGFVVLVKAGIIVREAARPTYRDEGSYTLSQGREVRPEEAESYTLSQGREVRPEAETQELRR